MKAFGEKRIFVFLLVFFLITSVVHGQLEQEDRNYKIGIKGGLNFSNLSVNSAINERTRTGVLLGVFYKHEIVRHFSLQPELLYSGKGAVVFYSNNNFTGIPKIRLHYFDIPVLLVYNPTPFFNISLGPYLGLLAGVNVKNLHAEIPEEAFFDFENEVGWGSFNTLDAGIIAGMGVEIGIFHAGMRYSFGMTEIGRTTRVFDVSYGFPGAQNRMAQLYIGLGF